MRVCPNCGWSNDGASRFCENCGADLETLGARSSGDHSGWASPQSETPARDRPYWEVAPEESEWQMAPLPPQQEPVQKRRTWLWVLTGMLVICMLFCAGSILFLGFTDTGKDFQTRVAENATEQAESSSD